MAKSTAFRFLDLPAELRNAIYMMLLAKRNRVKILGRKIRTVSNGKNANSTPRTKRIVYSVQSNSSAAILQVNRQIHAEATPIFYSTNTFFFGDEGNAADLCSFLQQIGSSKQHIRHVSLEYVSNIKVVQSALHLLKEAKMLETFELGQWLAAHLTLDQRIEALVPWMHSLVKARQGGSNVTNVQDITDILRVADEPRCNIAQDTLDALKAKLMSRI
ncbi:hypothetical protein LTR08_008240 [Meristemomyces frigidus]|nr:hypothetical protein LTR08_008240 [Meristemomyces frigidus]